MNFVGKFDAKLPVDGAGAPYVAHTHVDAASAHAPADAIIVPDAKLLFEGDFKRSGVDLILSKDGQETVVHDYFKGEKRAALSSPDGAHLTGDIVNALAGHVEYAQAGGGVAAAAAVVGHVTKLMGSATAIRNGVSIILNQGDNIEKGDVLQSGADSTLGVTFIDGTVFGLSSNARMVVNEMVYDPNGSSNSSLLSLVAGTISFVAGETAKHGDMKVDTPVATMGIRGTAVLVEIDFGVPGANGAPSANFQVLVEPDGTTGSYILFDKTTLTPLATVNAAGTLTKISQGVVSFQSGTGLTPEEQRLITDVFQQKFTDNSNPKTDHQFTDSLTPQLLSPIKLLDGLQATPVVVVVQGSGSVSQTSNLGAAGTQHIPGAPAIATFNELFNEHIGATGSPTLDTVTGKINFADINAGDLPTVAVKFTSFTYQDAHQTDISKTLTATELAAVQAVETIRLQTDEGNKNTGSATWTYSYPDGAFDFLGAGETLTLTYTAAVNNNFLQNPETGFKTFTITITGTNDVPVITSSVPQTIAFNGGTNVPGGDLIAHVPTSGTLAFDDPDLTDTHTVSVNLLLNGLDLPPAPLEIFQHALTASIGTDSTGTGFGTINWKLADLPVYLGDFVPQGQTITLTYAVTVTDSHGATSTQDITITITGTATPAVVWIATSETGPAPGELLWSNASNWETGTVPTINDDAIVITNQLIGLTPSFPLTIDAPAEAKSLTMNDFGNTPPEVINQSTLTLAGDLNMAADSIIHNSGTISVGGLIEVQGTSVLDNSGTLLLEQGGDLGGQSIITNTGSIEISGGMLNVKVDVDNSGQGEQNVAGRITIDTGAALTLGPASIIAGTVTNGGTLKLDTGASQGSSVLKNGTLNNNQALQAGSGAELRNETVTNDGTIEVLALGALLLDQGTSVSNGNRTITVDGTGTLTLDDANIAGGTITSFSSPASSEGAVVAGTIDVTGSSTISNAQLNNGQLTVESGQTLTLQGTAVHGGTLYNSGTVDVETSTGATLDGVTVTGPGTILIDTFAPATPPTTLVLENGTTVADGTLTVGLVGTLAVESSGGGTLSHETVTNNNSIEIFAGSALTLDNGTAVTNNGVITIDGSAALTLNDATLAGGTVIDNGLIDVIGDSTISNANLNTGSVTIESGQRLTLDGDTVTGTGFTNAGTGSAIDVDGGDTLSLSGVTVSGGGFTIGAGALVKTSGDVTLTTAISNDGLIEVTGGTLKIIGAVASDAGHSGSFQIDAGAVLDVDGSDSQNTVFNGANAELRIDTSSFGGSLSGLAATDEIDLSTIGYGPDTTATYISGILTLTDGSHSIGMTLTGDFSDLHFAGSSDGHGGTLIKLNATDDAPVFAAADKAELATVSELANTTGSPALDPSPGASGTLHFTDIDLTDRPTADVALSVSWTDGATDLTSSLTAAEISALENAFALSQSGNTNSGSLGWTYQISDSALDFLGAGATAKVTATITLDDHQGGTDTATVTVTLDGANDAPVIAGETDPATQTINLAHSPIVLAAGTSTNALGLHTETFDEQGIPVGSASNNGEGHGSFHSDALNAMFTSSGNAGVVNGSSSVTAPPFIGPTPGHVDGTNYLSVGAHGSETITFATEQNSFGLYWGSVDPSNTISFYDGDRLVASYSGGDIAPLLANGNQGSFSANGYVQFSDLAPFTKVVLASSTNAFEVDNISAGFHDELPAPITGTLTVNDADIGDTLTGTVIGNAVAEYNGSTTLPSGADISALIASGAITFDTMRTTGGPDVLQWTYNPANPDLSFLEPGDTLTLTFNATVSDGHATTANQPLTITLVGGGIAAPVPLTVNITSPALTTNHASQTIAGTGEAGSIVTLYDNGTALSLPTITVDQTGHWSSSVTLAEGTNSLVAHDADALGHAGVSVAVTYTVDTIAPTVAITTAGESTGHASQTIVGTGEAGTTITLFDNGTALTLPTITVDQTGHWSSTVTLANGANSIIAHDTDAVGNVGTSTAASFTLDTTAPTVTESLASDTGSSPTDKITSNDALTGSGLANAVVHFSVDGTSIEATATADAQGVWSFTPAGLADGTHTVVASETDNLGNTGTATLGFTLDTTPPDVTITSPSVTTNTATQTIHGTVTDHSAVGTTVTIYDSATSGGSISALGSSLLTAGHNLVNGMGGATGFGTQILETGDDNSSSAIDITSVFGSAGVNFFGHDYASIYLNNNGNITFAQPSGTYTPSSIDGGVNNPIIAPFWADVDTRGGAATATPGGNSTGANQVIYNLDAADGVLTITWDDVGYYSASTDKLDAFQVQLISLGNGNFDIVYRYENVNWTTGSASGGSDGLGGTPARAGYSAGDGTNYYELPQSGNQAALLSLPNTPGNTGIAGVDVFQVINGVVGTPTVTPVGTAIVQADGTWSTDVTLTNGTNSLTAQDTDAAGNSGTSAPVTFTLDSAANTDSVAAFQSLALADSEAQPAHWLNATSGDFAAASNWSNDSVPAATDDAVINVTGAYTVTSAANENVHSIDLGTDVTLDIGGGTFTISNGGENDGLVKVEHAGSVLSVGGTVTNTGTIEAFDEAIQNASPATVALNDAHIAGGTVEAIAGGEISAVSGTNSIDAAVTIDADSSFVVDHGATVTVNAADSALATTNDGVIEVQSGGTAIWAGTLSGTGAIHIDSGASFELNTTSAAGGQALTFEGSTGSLTLDHPASFTGTISGFTGDGTLSGSDQIDLKGIDYHSNSFSESFNADSDTLSVTDGTNSAVLHFNGSYQAANFSFTTDNNGGTIVYDPPVTDNAAAKPAAVTADSNGFVFNFANHGQDASGPHPTTETHLFDGQTFVNADTDPNKPHDDGHGQTAPVPESMDAATIAAVKAQLHAHDFHFA